jgi:hypothetical protein
MNLIINPHKYSIYYSEQYVVAEPWLSVIKSFYETFGMSFQIYGKQKAD